MESIKIKRSSLSGEVAIPPSKSQTMRALAFALLAKGPCVVYNPLSSPDTDAMIRASRLLGAKVDCFSDRIEVHGSLRPAEDVIDCGNSGLVLRFIGAIASLLPTHTILTGDLSIRHRRHIQPLLEGINQLGGWAVSSRGDGHAPIIIRGPLKGGQAYISGEDSQPVSGLLIASCFAPDKTELFVKDPGEKPWVSLTLSWLDRFNIPYKNHHFSHYEIAGNASIPGFTYKVPGDWSSALYPIAAALVTNSEITIHGVDFNDAQGDKEVVTLLQEMGAKISVHKDSVTIHAGSSLRGAQIDIGRFIDAITLLPVLACQATGPTQIYGGMIARAKESDRIQAIVSELKKMGARIEETSDGMIVHPSELQGASVTCFEDHRMALSLSIAGLMAHGSTEIAGIECAKKSFPGYFEMLRKLGAAIE
ncbi:MAG: 3-phosphoshikimate 1-carboxyvinyltransferase [Rhabdochlamydiaceae bacterium]|nr:3-phosphoshikimate 1-carboxyvinyltransferase [Rhabdochlamydiaceae bacterium]